MPGKAVAVALSTSHHRVRKPPIRSQRTLTVMGAQRLAMRLAQDDDVSQQVVSQLQDGWALARYTCV
jgi:hypothetical protein